jgi:signal peptidase
MVDDERPPRSPSRSADNGGRSGSFLRELLGSLLVVFALALVLLLVSGVWPPLVAIESGSMDPNMQKGDLVFVTETGRFGAEEAFRDTGVVTHRTGMETGHRSFGAAGSVVIFDPPERHGPPVIHRVRFWVEDGENWYPMADERYVDAGGCAELSNCPAPHSGFVTKGDHNGRYDQASGIAAPVKPSWITGTAHYRVPYLGCIRLEFTGTSCRQPAI